MKWKPATFLPLSIEWLGWHVIGGKMSVFLWCTRQGWKGGMAAAWAWWRDEGVGQDKPVGGGEGSWRLMGLFEMWSVCSVDNNFASLISYIVLMVSKIVFFKCFRFYFCHIEKLRHTNKEKKHTSGRSDSGSSGAQRPFLENPWVMEQRRQWGFQDDRWSPMLIKGSIRLLEQTSVFGKQWERPSGLISVPCGSHSLSFFSDVLPPQ